MWKKENGNEAIDNKFSNFKARNKVCVKHLNIKRRGVWSLLRSEGHPALEQIIKQTRHVTLICFEAKLHGCKFHRCVWDTKMLNYLKTLRQKQATPDVFLGKKQHLA